MERANCAARLAGSYFAPARPQFAPPKPDGRQVSKASRSHRPLDRPTRSPASPREQPAAEAGAQVAPRRASPTLSGGSGATPELNLGKPKLKPNQNWERIGTHLAGSRLLNANFLRSQTMAKWLASFV